MTSERGLRIALVSAGLAAFIVVIDVFPAAFRVVCLVLIALATAIAAPLRPSRGGGWWWLLAGGAAASIAGAIIAQPAVTAGGWLALIGGLLVIVAAAIGFPTEGE